MVSETLPPVIRAQLDYLLSLFPHFIKVDRMWSSSKNHGLLDRFTLAIPFCSDYLRWDVIYNAQCPSAAPDIIFEPGDETFRPFRGNSRSSNNSLLDWNGDEPSRLACLIRELREEYMDYQRKRIEEVDDDRVKFEISTILSRKGIEMRLISGFEKPEEVKLVVSLLGMDINKLVAGCTWKHQQKLLLQVVFPVGRKHVSTSSSPRLKLVASSELKAIFSIEDVKLPPWLDGMCMAEYLPNLEHTLERQILDAVSAIDARRRFIEALATVFGKPVEADPTFCRKATFFSVAGVFTFLVHFLVPTQFPKQQPALMLQSCQHFTLQGVPLSSAHVTDYPWSPRWEPLHMAERIFEFMADECLKFKLHCNEATSRY